MFLICSDFFAEFKMHESLSSLSITSKQSKANQGLSEISLENKFCNIVDDVEIIPAKMMFMNAYEGKEFSRTVTLKNIGTKIAFVRIGAPTAKMFQMKPMERICRLSPGLSLSRMIKMKYSSIFSIHGTQIPIYINNSTIQYPLIICLNQAKVIVKPTEVNFGNIDAVSSVVTRTVVIQNEGSKSAHFYIDLGRNELELIVEPTRGVLEASESVTLKLEVMGFYEGPFRKEFWIKTVPPKRVTVVGEFITPKIIPTYPKEHADFRVINFPRLYVGETSTRTLMIKNASSSDVMFCIKGMHNKQILLYEEAAKINENFRSFRLNPMEGRMKSQETTVITITYHPIISVGHHAVCFIQVIRVDCTDVDDSLIRAIEVSEPSQLSGNEDKKNSVLSMASTIHLVLDDDQMDGAENDSGNLVTERKIAEVESFKVCLYGDKEEAKVAVQPERISFNQIQVDDVQTRELRLENCSANLPVTVRYLKVTFIDVWPRNIYLKPKEVKEVLVRIKPKNAGFYFLKTTFELLVQNFSDKGEKIIVGHVELKISFTAVLKTSVPRTKFVTKLSPDNTNEVGFMAHAIQFNSKVEKPKAAVLYENKKIFREDDSCLIAFPNDRSRSLRPWTENKTCKTIFAQIPRTVVSHDEFGYSSTTLLLKRENRNYYIQYLKQKQGNAAFKKKKMNSGYEVTRKWMLKGYACEAREEDQKQLPSASALFPLSPTMLHNVKIGPKYIRLQRVAPVSDVECTFKIHNQNSFPIFVYVTAVKLGIHFPQGHYKIVKANEKKILSLTCFAGLVGRYINLIEVIVNFCHLYTISVMVEVVPKKIGLEETVLDFQPEKHGNIKFIELHNNLNSSISFSTHMSFSRYKIEPPQATIHQKRSLLCAVIYENVPEMPDYCELVVTSEGGGAQIVQISRKKKKPKVEIHPPSLNIIDLPLNIRKTYRLRVRNTMNYNICYLIVDPAPLEGVEIFPFHGIIDATAETEFVITVNMADKESFETNFEFVFDDKFTVLVPVEGTIVIPTVEIKPENIVNRQLIPFAYRRNIFYVKNVSVCDCVVRFELDHYDYFRVTEDETDLDGTVHNTDLKLLPGEVKTLYLHFNPLDALTESFYLPIVINDIIGPPLLTFGESVHFILNQEEHASSTKIPCLKITSICGAPSLHFSTLKLRFRYAVSDIHNEQLTKFFTVKNEGFETVEFCIRTDKREPQFDLGYQSGKTVKFTSYSVVCELLPGESTVFFAQFLPDVPGRIVNSLPIYVRNYLDGCIFNYLRLFGTYKKPKITTISEIFYLGCTPLEFRSCVFLDLQTKYHKSDCQMSFSSSAREATIYFRERARGQSRNITKVRIGVTSKKPTSTFTSIQFECTCAATCNIKLVAFCDNCFLSHYAFFFINRDFIKKKILLPTLLSVSECSIKNQYSRSQGSMTRKISSAHLLQYTLFAEYPESENIYHFPFFPMTKDGEVNHQYNSMMKNTLRFVERWISSQAFYRTKYFKIPQTISLSPVGMKTESTKTGYVLEPTILTFLVELAGVQAREASVTTKVTTFTPKNIALHFFTTYSNMLQYLRNKGALLPHIFSEYLLTFQYYEIIHEEYSDLIEIEEKFDEEKFLAYSAQCYLDVILQSIKIFILSHIRMFDIGITPSTPEIADSEEKRSGSLWRNVEDVIIPNCYIFMKNEQILLYWLQYSFDNQKNRLWQSHFLGENEELEQKEIKVFGEDLNDSLVFACVTAAYCPYLAHKLTNMYVPPSSYEEYHHNACAVIKTWNLLKLSYLVEPNDIVNPNGINMFLLTLYLYEILPSFYPEESLTLTAKLTQVSRANISLSNHSRHQISYAIVFFNNESESFTSEIEHFKLHPGKSGVFEIKYQAKKISSQKAILVLSGEVAGQKYGRSRCIDLNGITDLNLSTKHLEFKCDCYKIYRMKIHLFNPYNVPDTYQILYKMIAADEEDIVRNESELLSWKEYIQGKIPKVVYSKEYEFNITNPEEGFFFEPIMCCRSLMKKRLVMFMVGKHGDWCFDIKLFPKISKQIYEVINVSLPRDFYSQGCSCKEKSNEISFICPRTIIINIPSKNNFFFKSTKEFFIACTDEKFLPFWKQYLPIRTVFNILRSQLFEDAAGMKTSDYRIIFEKTCTFNVRTDTDSPLTAMKQIVIDDVSSEGGTELIVHLNPGFDDTVDSTIIALHALSGITIRYYKLNFYQS